MLRLVAFLPKPPAPARGAERRLFIWRVMHEEEVWKCDGAVKPADGASRVVSKGRMICKRNMAMEE